MKVLITLFPIFFAFQLTKAQRNDSLTVPQLSYSINSLPIHVCFIKDRSYYVGFIIAGHAYKSVCSAASLEVSRLLKKEGYTGETVSSFGIGYDLRPRAVDKTYNLMVANMYTRLARLAKNNPDEIILQTISLSTYQALSAKIKHAFLTFRQAFDNGSTKQNRYIIRYENVPHPVVVPFFQHDSIIRLTVPNKVFGEIPALHLFADLRRDFMRSDSIANICIIKNRITLRKLSGATDNTRDYKFHYFRENLGLIDSVPFNLGKFPLTPPGFTITTKDAFGNILNSRPITFKEALRAQFDPNTTFTAEAQRNLKDFISLGKLYQKKFESNKIAMERDLIRMINSLQDDKVYILSYLNSTLSEDEEHEQQVVIDAFLRGWNFQINDSVTNRSFRLWYKERPAVWKQILSQYPQFMPASNALYRNDDKDYIAGIFQSERVFFDVRKEGANFTITPFFLLGNSFLQVTDHYIDTPLFYSLSEFKSLKN